ncbi:MAG: hypothetical protein ACAH21_11405 [Ramlibacter sp.]|nr:hypothetical protein [Ramlibacter sp.]
MSRLLKLSIAIALAIVFILAAVTGALRYWVNSDDFRQRVSQQIASAIGVPVHLGGISVDVWPLPAVALEQVQVKSQPPLSLGRIEARPVWMGLLQGRLEIATLIVRDAVVPAPAVAAITAAAAKQRPGGAAKGAQAGGMAMLPHRVVLDDVTWVDNKGVRTTVDGEGRRDADGLPSSVRIEVVRGRLQGAKATMQRKGDDWALDAKVGGGSITGKLQLRQAKGGPLLTGQLETKDVEVSALTAPSRTLTGRLEASTSLDAQVREIGALADALQTRTKFIVHGAVIHGIDLAKAVKTVGMNRSGETRLDTLAGNVTTRGQAVQVTNLVANSGLMAATGNVNMAPDKTLNGRVDVTASVPVGGRAIAVPLAVGGTLDSPSVTLSSSALAGAAIGAATAPGGGSLGDRLKGLFGK